MPSATFRLDSTTFFEMEFEQALNYIEIMLRRPSASDALQTEVEGAVHARLASPLAFEPVPTRANREHSYYRIYVGDYIVFYCVIGNVMELRRFIYKGRNWKIQI